jgi:hypothetical protein
MLGELSPTLCRLRSGIAKKLRARVPDALRFGVKEVETAGLRRGSWCSPSGYTALLLGGQSFTVQKSQ